MSSSNFREGIKPADRVGQTFKFGNVSKIRYINETKNSRSKKLFLNNISKILYLFSLEHDIKSYSIG